MQWLVYEKYNPVQLAALSTMQNARISTHRGNEIVGKGITCCR